MELNKSILLNKAMIWGLFTGIASILVASAFYIAGLFLSPALGWVLFLVYTGGIVMSAKAYKKAIAEDAPFAYGKAVGLGVATLFFASIIMALFYYILYAFVDPQLVDQAAALAEEASLQMGLSEEMVEQQMVIQRKLLSPMFIAVSQMFNVILFGLFISIITSIFLKKKPENGFNAAMNEIDNE